MQAADCEILDRMWADHRDSVRRVLLSLTRDIDLADDLLQDTYLRARQGISGFRGGNPQPWLAAIARNVYYSHARLRRTRAEVACDLAESSEQSSPVDSLALLAIRQALAELPAALRTALVMKHYAGYTYQEIASHQHCPIGTAKWRVSEALDRLRRVLQERRVAMTSAQEHGIVLVDYVYGILPPEEAAKVRAHLAKCGSCRNEANELKQVASALDALEGDHKQMHFVEVDSGGRVTLYAAGSHVNTSEKALSTWHFNSGRGGRVQHYYQDGEEATFTVEPSTQWDYLDSYTVTLPHPVPPGERVNELAVFPTDQMSRVESLGDGRFRLHWKQTPGDPAAYVQAIRLPAGARLLSATPQPAETKTNGTTTLVWRTVLADEEAFECTVEYALQ